MINKLIHLANLLDFRGFYREANFLDSLLKRAGDFKQQCKIYYVDEEYHEQKEFDDDDLEYQDVLDKIDELFKNVNINKSDEDRFYEACIDKDGEVSGASVISYNDNEKSLRFSVVVSPEAQGGGIGRELVQNIVRDHKREWKIDAWVVNPNMAALLTTLGFETLDGGEWSQENPIMEYKEY